MAIGALVSGLLGLGLVMTVILVFVAFVPGVAAVALGIAGVRRAGRHPLGQGRGMAVAGIVTGALATLASVGAFLIVALFVASSDFTLIDTEPVGPDDVRLTDRTCRVDGAFAVAGGVLTNTSGAEHGFAVTVQFLDGSRTLGSATEELEHDLEDGASWSWEVQLGVDPEQVNTDSLECRVDRVDIGEVVSD